jgi:hypothetical protein
MMKWLIGGWLLGVVLFLAFLWRAANRRPVPARAKEKPSCEALGSIAADPFNPNEKPSSVFP